MLLDPATAEGSGTPGSCGFWSSWSDLFSSSGKNRKGATSTRKRAQPKSSKSTSEFADDEDEGEGEGKAEENEDESEDGVDSVDGVEGPFAHGQHVIFGIAHVGGPGGVGSLRGGGGNRSWRRLDARNERGGT